MKGIIRHLTQNPIKLFLVDGIGAFLTAFFLFAILRPFHEYFGMPQNILIFLSAIAAMFCLYSMTCFFIIKDNWPPFLRVISIANLIYCCLTLGLVIYFFKSLTDLGVAYFLAEIILVCGLVYVEFKVLSQAP